MPSMLLEQCSEIQPAIHDRPILSSSPAAQKRVPGAIHLQHPSKRLKAGQHHYTGISNLSSPMTKHIQTREQKDAGVTALLSPLITSGRPSSMRGDPVGRFKAEKWFDETNKDASGMRDVPFLDDDPPFYINRQPSSDVGSACAVRCDGSPINLSNLGPSTAPTRSLLARMESSENNSEDFRSVIDDLTIQNNKLKRKLKKYEKLHCSHLQDEKLFEVRVHSLTAHRKRELEETLRSFASIIDEDSPPRPLVQPTGLQHLAPADPPALHKPSSSSTSNSKPIDSAYASMSGQTGMSQPQMQDQNKPDVRGYTPHIKQQKVKSYLHDIPETLMPKHSMAMSDRSKSKIVVKRLEQIFTGKGAASRRHNQSHQQQEVSQSAAQADRTRLKARGRPTTKEGIREARILHDDTHLHVDSMSEANLAAQISRSSNDGEDSTRNTQASRDTSPEQRPTRPLDLDLHRAQVPSDNIDYIRHLGLAAHADQTSKDDEWVYLNLLISMAQLHTLNVTPEFIRHAIADVSSQFELSADGTKIRWQGGTEGTRMSSDSEESEGVAKWKSTETSHSASKQGSFADLSEVQEPNSALPNLASESSAVPEAGAKRRPVTFGQHNDGGRFHYKPLFFHTAPSEEDEDDSVPPTENSSTDWRENATGLISGLNSGSHGLRETEARLRKKNQGNGPIIFYNKARFCTDLSGDPSGAMIDEDTYQRFTQDPVGVSPATPSEYGDEPTDLSIVDREELMELDLKSSQTTRSALDLEDLKSSISDCASLPGPMDMEVSGLGGIQPEDNFVIRVQMRHGGIITTRGSCKSSPFLSLREQIHRMLHRLPQRNLDVFREENQDIPRSQPPPPLKTEIISAVKRNLPPSSLPPPSYNFSPSDYDDDEYEDDRNDINPYENPCFASPRHSGGVVLEPRPTDFFIGTSSEESKESSYTSASSGSDSDSSIDLLAHARVLDPDTIAAREREFDDNGPLPSAKPLASSSSAVTAGGASRHAIQKPIGSGESDVDSMSVDGIGLSELGKST